MSGPGAMPGMVPPPGMAGAAGWNSPIAAPAKPKLVGLFGGTQAMMRDADGNTVKVSVGDQIDGYHVDQINSNGVTLSKDKVSVKVSLEGL